MWRVVKIQGKIGRVGDGNQCMVYLPGDDLGDLMVYQPISEADNLELRRREQCLRAL